MYEIKVHPRKVGCVQSACHKSDKQQQQQNKVHHKRAEKILLKNFFPSLLVVVWDCLWECATISESKKKNTSKIVIKISISKPHIIFYEYLTDYLCRSLFLFVVCLSSYQDDDDIFIMKWKRPQIINKAKNNKDDEELKMKSLLEWYMEIWEFLIMRNK